MQKNNFPIGKSILSFITIIFSVITLSLVPVIYADTTAPTYQESLSILDSKIHYSTEDGYSAVSCIGTIQNKSKHKWEDLVLEVQFFNSENELIDTITENVYSLVVPPNDKITFRVRQGADRKKEEYKTHRVRITSATSKDCAPKKKRSNPLLEIIISWTPMLLLIAVWIFFMRKYQGKNSPQNKIIENQEKQYELIRHQNELFEKLIDAIKNK